MDDAGAQLTTHSRPTAAAPDRPARRWATQEGSAIVGPDLGGATLDLEGGTYSVSRPVRFPALGGGNMNVLGGTIRAAAGFKSNCTSSCSLVGVVELLGTQRPSGKHTPGPYAHINFVSAAAPVASSRKAPKKLRWCAGAADDRRQRRHLRRSEHPVGRRRPHHPLQHRRLLQDRHLRGMPKGYRAWTVGCLLQRFKRASCGQGPAGGGFVDITGSYIGTNRFPEEECPHDFPNGGVSTTVCRRRHFSLSLGCVLTPIGPV